MPQPRKSAGSAGTHFQEAVLSLSPGRSAGSTVTHYQAGSGVSDSSTLSGQFTVGVACWSLFWEGCGSLETTHF